MEKEVENIEKLRTTDSLNCPNCGANLEYSPEKKALFCKFCGTTIKIEAKKVNEERLVETYDNKETNFLTTERVFKCQNCGASTILEKNITAAICPFCGSNHVMQIDDVKGLKPTSLIPFQIGEVEANTIYKTWIKKKLYAPKDMLKNVNIGQIKGVYEPVYTFDSQTVSNYVGRLGKYYTKTVGSGKNAHTVTEVRYFKISGAIQVDFDDILVNASDKISQEMINRIEPYDTNNGVEYNSSFLQSFSAEHYSKDMFASYEDAKKIMLKKIEFKILNQYTYDVVDYLNISPYYNNSTFKYMLVPVWFLNYKYKKKSYGVTINGSTGKIAGKYPISVFKVILTVLIVLIIIGACLFAYYSLK